MRNEPRKPCHWDVIGSPTAWAIKDRLLQRYLVGLKPVDKQVVQLFQLNQAPVTWVFA